jgi:cystathionine beta-lyase/cystathionine gamma-synthase
MSNTFGELPIPNLASVGTLQELDVSLNAKGTYDPGNGLYPRDGTDNVTQIEALISSVTIPDQRLNLIWASGMSAVRESVNFATTYMAEQSRDGDRPVVAYAQDLYSQSTTFFQKEQRKGVNIVRFDSGDGDEVAGLIDKNNVDVIFAETVANTPDMPVLDVKRLLDHVRSIDNPPVLILDNTLPLSTGINFAELLRPDDRVIIVESGTKNLMNNSDLLGISYGGNAELMDALRNTKRIVVR